MVRPRIWATCAAAPDNSRSATSKRSSGLSVPILTFTSSCWRSASASARSTGSVTPSLPTCRTGDKWCPAARSFLRKGPLGMSERFFGFVAAGKRLPLSLLEILELASELGVLRVQREAALDVPFREIEVPRELRHLRQEEVTGHAARDLLQRRLDDGGAILLLALAILRQEELHPGAPHVEFGLLRVELARLGQRLEGLVVLARLHEDGRLLEELLCLEDGRYVDLRSPPPGEPAAGLRALPLLPPHP